MICPSCSYENDPGNKFCGGCGKPLARQCRNCSAELAPDAKFCGQCGSPAVDTGKLAPDMDAERRFVTVMFCDLEGSTELSSTLDPEELMAVIKKYQGEVARVVDRYSGHIA